VLQTKPKKIFDDKTLKMGWEELVHNVVDPPRASPVSPSLSLSFFLSTFFPVVYKPERPRTNEKNSKAGDH
jgi:hypothetical protein